MQRWRISPHAIAVLQRAGYSRSSSSARRAWSSDQGQLSTEDLTAARKWYADLNDSTALGSIGRVDYSRSSGPGGQNVNKVNTKAQLRVPLHELLPLVPRALHAGIRSSRYYASSTDTLLIQADDSRRQATNKESCYRKLTETLLDVYKATIPGETSQDQKAKVKKLKEAENEARLKRKKIQSSKKAFRRGSNE